MNQPAKDPDQSMEEILQSIKRIIAEEDEVAPPGSDVLELTEMVEEDAPAPAAAASTEAEATEDLAALTIDEIMALRKEEAAQLEAAKAKLSEPPVPSKAPKTAPPPAAMVPEPPAADDEDTLISDSTFAAAAAEFDKLKNIPDPLPTVPHLDSMALRSGTTVEDLVLEALRPMLRDWLDANLPEIVQRLVEREVRKIAAR